MGVPPKTENEEPHSTSLAFFCSYFKELNCYFRRDKGTKLLPSEKTRRPMERIPSDGTG
jgi:hypothetical protein